MPANSRRTRWRLLVWRPLSVYPWSYAAMVAALAIGVAMMTAVELVNTSALTRFDAGVRRMAGGVDLQVAARFGPLRDRDLVALRSTPGIQAALPVMRGRLSVDTAGGATSIPWMAFDLFAESWARPRAVLSDYPRTRPEALFERGSVLAGAAVARALNLTAGSTLATAIAGQVQQIEVVGLLPPGSADHVLVLDIATAQWTFARLGELDRIDLVLVPEADREDVARRVQARLEGRVAVTQPTLDSERLNAMTRSYRVNLRVLSAVALLTAAFLIWSLLDLALHRRIPEFRLLTALGLSGERLAGLLFATGLMVLVPGTVLGVVFGYAIAMVTLVVTGGDLGAGYFDQSSVWPTLAPGVFALSIGIAFGVTMFACIGPIRRVAQALKAPESATFAPDSGSTKVPFVLSAAALVGAWVVAQLPSVGGVPAGGYAAIALVLAAAVGLTPCGLRLALRNRRWSPAYPRLGLVIARLRSEPARAGLVAGAALVSFSLVVAMSGMVWSFRGSVDGWLSQVLRADFFVSSGAMDQADFLTPADVAAVERMSDVGRVERLRDLRLVWPGAAPSEPEVLLSGRDLDMPGVRRMLGLKGRGAVADECVVSESLAARFGVRSGDSLRLPPSGADQRCRVAAIWRDYGYQWGRVVVHRPVFQRLTGDRDFSGLAISLTPSADPAAARIALEGLFAHRPGVQVSAQGALRQAALAEFDRAFAVTYVLVAIAAAVGVLAVLNAQLVQMDQRRAELAVLNHLGWSLRDLKIYLAAEAAILAGLGVAGGALSGLVCTRILNRVVNYQSFLWTIDTHLPWRLMVAAGGILIAAAAVGGALIAGRALRADSALTLAGD